MKGAMMGILESFLSSLLLKGTWVTIKAIFKDDPQSAILNEAIKKTVLKCRHLDENLETHLRTWMESEGFRESTDSMDSIGTRSGSESLIKVFIESGFHHDDEKIREQNGEGILREFFDELEKAILFSDYGMQYHDRKMTAKFAEIGQQADTRHEELISKLNSLSEGRKTNIPQDMAPGLAINLEEDDQLPKEFAIIKDLLKENRLKSASDALEALAGKFDSNTPDVSRYYYYSNKGWLALANNELSSALDLFEKAKTYWEERPAVYRNIGLTHLMMGKGQKALECVEKAFELGDESDDAHKLKSQALAASSGVTDTLQYVSDCPLSESDKSHMRGVICLNDNQWEKAISNLEAAIEDMPDSYEVRLAACAAHVGLVSEKMEEGTVPFWLAAWEEKDHLSAAKKHASRALVLLQDSDQYVDTARALSYLAFVSFAVGQQEESDAYIKKVDESPCIDPHSKFRIALLKLNSGDDDAAKEMLERLKNETEVLPTKMGETVEALLQEIENSENAEGGPKGVVGPPPQMPDWQTNLEKARAAYTKDEWSKVVSLLDGIITAYAPRALIQQYLISLYDTRQFTKVIDFIDLCKAEGRVDSNLLQFEITIWETHGDYDKALASVKELENISAPHLMLRLKKAELLFKNDNLDEARELLPTVEEYGIIKVNMLRIALGLFTELGEYEKAIELGYNALVRYFEEPDAHLSYAMLLFLFKEPYAEILKTEQCDVGIVVIYEDDAGNTHQVLFDDVPGIRGLEVRTTKTGLFNTMKGKKAGDKVIAMSDGMGSIKLTIKELCNKYLWTFRNVVGKFNERFPEATGLRKVFISEDELEPFRKLASSIENMKERWQEFYFRGEAPLGVLAKFRDTTDQSVYSSLTAGELGGLIACDKHPGATDHEVQLLADNQNICLDMTSALALHTLGKLAEFKSITKKIFVDKLSLESVKYELKQNERLRGDGSFTLSFENGSPVVHEFTKKQMGEYLDSQHKMIDWILDNATVVTPSLHILETLGDLRENMTITTSNNLAIAKEYSALLLSEDLHLRKLASRFMGVNSSWSLPVLTACKRQHKADIDLDEVLINLLSLNYLYLPILPSTIMRAIQMDDYRPGVYLNLTLGVFIIPEFRAEVAVGIISDAVKQIALLEVDGLHKSLLLAECLGAIAAKGNWQRDKHLMITILRQKLRLAPLQLQVVKDQIVAFERAKLMY